MRGLQQRPRFLVGAVSVLALVGLIQGPAQAAEKLKPGVYNVEKLLQAGLDKQAGGFTYKVVAETGSGGVELFQLDAVKLHYHPKENHFLYILKGRAKGMIGTVSAEVGPGDLVVIPAGKPNQHKFEKIGDEPVVFLLFSSPPFRDKDIVWVEK